MQSNTRALPAVALVSLCLAAPANADEPAKPAATPAPTAAKGDELESMPTEAGPVPVPSKMLASWREALVLASAQDPDYSVALLEVDRQKGVARQTLAGTLPTITATGNVTFNLIQADVQGFDTGTGSVVTRTVPASPTASAGISLRQPLIAPRVWWAIGTADEQVKLAETSVQNRQRVLVAALADAIVTEVTAERIAEVNRVGLRAAEERLRLQKRRRTLGAGSDLDIVRYEQDVVAAKASYDSGDETLVQARERLGLLLGSTEGVGVKPDISIDEIKSTLGKICKKGQLVDRSDLQVLIKQKEISERALTDADLMYAPTADLLANFNYSSEQIIGDGHASFSIQGVLTVPIWDGGARYGVRRSAEAVVKQQSERIDGAVRSAKVEMTQSERAVQVAQNAQSIAERNRDLAKTSDRLVQVAFEEGGNVTSFDLVDAARRVREAELQLTVRELELVRAKIAALLADSNCSY